MSTKAKTVQVQLRLPHDMIRYVHVVAKLSGTTPTDVYNVLLALAVLQQSK